MKNSHRGFIVPLLLIIIAALLAGGGYLYTQNQKLNESVKSDTQATSTVPAKVVKNTPVPAPTPAITLPSTCTNGGVSPGEPGVPVITSISKTSGPLGTQLEIKGCNFSGFEGQKTVWIENNQGVEGMLVENSSSSNTLLKAKLESPLCSEDNSFSGKSCTSELNLTPGTYTIFTRPWGKKSNVVTFTVTGSPTAQALSGADSRTVTVTSPKVGEVWVHGSQHVIRWTGWQQSASTTIRHDISISLQPTSVSPKNPEVQVSIGSGGSGTILSTGSYTWTVPSSVPIGEYRVAVCPDIMAGTDCTSSTYSAPIVITDPKTYSGGI